MASHFFSLRRSLVAALVFVVVCVVLATPTTAPGQTKAPIALYGNDANPPKTWSDNGAPRGILVDVVREISVRSGLAFEIRQRPWARAYEQALQGYGGVYGLSMTQERLELFDYSEPIFLDEILLVARKGKEFPFESMADLLNKRIGTTRGAVYGDEFQDAMETVFIPVYSSDPVIRLRMLLEGRIDAAVIGPGKAGLRFYLKKDPYLIDYADQFVVLDKPLALDPNYIGFRKSDDNAEILDAVNRAVDVMRQDGTLDAISRSYKYQPGQ